MLLSGLSLEILLSYQKRFPSLAIVREGIFRASTSTILRFCALWTEDTSDIQTLWVHRYVEIASDLVHKSTFIFHRLIKLQNELVTVKSTFSTLYLT